MADLIERLHLLADQAEIADNAESEFSLDLHAAADALAEIREYAKKASDNAWGGEYGRGIEIAGDTVLDILAEHERENAGSSDG